MQPPKFQYRVPL